MPHRASHYRLATFSCFVGIFTQAIITNLTAILFIPLMSLYGFSYIYLGILVGINFTTQVVADIIFSGLIDKIGFKKITTWTCLAAFGGLVLFGLTPTLFPGNEFTGFVISTIIFAFSCGLLEVVLSPIIDAIPNEDKGPAMSLMHSFYAWGQVATIIITTLFIFFAGQTNWQLIAFFWSLVPLTAFFMFYKAAMPPNSDSKTRSRARDLFMHPFYILALAAILFGGATEVCMNQWASTFLDGALAVPKVVGDLLGMCGFAVMLGLGRVLHGAFGAKVSINRVLVISSGMAVLCYIVVALSPFNTLNIVACAVSGLFCSILWPGVLVVSSEKFPLAGAWMFAILAAAGDIGAAASPYLTGLITDISVHWRITGRIMELYDTSNTSAALRLGILASLVFPLATFILHIMITKLKKEPG
ncbi:MAG: MFS transporter [Saccharofermentanales bacterium]